MLVGYGNIGYYRKGIMTYLHDRRKEKRKIRRSGKDRWYHGIIDFGADVLWFFVDIPWMILRGIWYVFVQILKFIGRFLGSIFEVLGDVADIFN
jgi:hypothetical protein